MFKKRNSPFLDQCMLVLFVQFRNYGLKYFLGLNEIVVHLKKCLHFRNIIIKSIYYHRSRSKRIKDYFKSRQNWDVY